MLQKSLTKKQFLYIEMLIMIIFCFTPLLFNNPYRINIFLSWEGAYRISEGQLPFRDFSLPMGYGYWLLPALFFKLFGPFMYSLIKAQVFINLISIIALRSILNTLNLKQETILFSIIVFCLSYVSKNFWPWYNHTVFVYELVGLAFILYAVLRATGNKQKLLLTSGALFIFLSFFTKQDIGAMAILLSFSIVLYHSVITKSYKPFLHYTIFFLLIASIFIIPLLQYDFLYWFNLGQSPHESRLVLSDFLNHWIGWSYWEKFFIIIIIILCINNFDSIHEFALSKEKFLFTLISIVIILEGMVVHVTSPVPPGNEIFFYTFGFTYLIENFNLKSKFSKPILLTLLVGLIIIWWSGLYWRNIQRIILSKPAVVAKTEKLKSTKYRLATEFKSMEHLFLAEETINGIHLIKNLEIVKNNTDLKVLNMTELTSLAYELQFKPPVNQPMWYHQGVSIFQKQINEFCLKIDAKQYDLVLFQDIPHSEVVNFFPEEIKACLEKNYKYEFTFLAPRTPEESFIHVYTKPKSTNDLSE